MVRLVDLDEDDGLDAAAARLRHASKHAAILPQDDASDPNYALKLSIVLSCYPIVSTLVQYVDLNTLHELSRACRQFRANLLQHRKPLMDKALRCINENTNPSCRLGDALSASVEQWRAFGNNGVKAGRISGGKVANCARDKVDECRRCGQDFCRNCVIKTPKDSDVKKRHRRLCRTCMKAPLDRLTVASFVKCDNGSTSLVNYTRGHCTCEQEGVWICRPCGQMHRSIDITYLRGWAWRSRYSACGGVGAGLGEGNEGVECGRGGDCLNVREIENEIECDADELAALEAEMERTDIDGRQWAGNSYMTHEIVGLGGKVKKKIKKIVRVGAIVKEYEDERERVSEVLRREQEGTNRSWCGWCHRVVPGKKDLMDPDESSDGVASTDSESSSGRSSPLDRLALKGLRAAREH